jgi:hypothetical protein
VRLNSREEVVAEVRRLLTAPDPTTAEGGIAGSRPKALLASLRIEAGRPAQLLPPDITESVFLALQSGWDVEHLVRLDLASPSVDEDIRAMVSLLTLEGSYEPLTIDDAQEFTFDVLAVPGRGLIFYGPDHGYYHPRLNEKHSDVVLEQAYRLRGQASRLFTRYRHDHETENALRYRQAAALESTPGDCRWVTSRLSSYARPAEYWRNDATRRYRHSHWLDDKLRVVSSFSADVTRHNYSDIASRPSLETWLHTGWFADVSRDKNVSTPVGDRRITLEHLIEVLTTDGFHYNLRLEDDPSDTGITEDSWFCKGHESDSSAFIFARGSACSNMHIEVRNQRLAEYFWIQFELAWGTLERRAMSRRETVEWLWRQLEDLPSS